MGEETFAACSACGNRVHSTDQRTCPHCLEVLEPRTFKSQQALADFQADRAHHGKTVEPVRSPAKRGVAGVMLFVGVLMVFAGAGILLGGLQAGGAVTFTSSLGDAVIPLSMGAALFAVGLKAGGWLE